MYLKFLKKHITGIAKGQCIKMDNTTAAGLIKDKFASEISDEEYNEWKAGKQKALDTEVAAHKKPMEDKIATDAEAQEAIDAKAKEDEAQLNAEIEVEAEENKKWDTRFNELKEIGSRELDSENPEDKGGLEDLYKIIEDNDLAITYVKGDKNAIELAALIVSAEKRKKKEVE